MANRWLAVPVAFFISRKAVACSGPGALTAIATALAEAKAAIAISVLGVALWLTAFAILRDKYLLKWCLTAASLGIAQSLIASTAFSGDCGSSSETVSWAVYPILAFIDFKGLMILMRIKRVKISGIRLFTVQSKHVFSSRFFRTVAPEELPSMQVVPYLVARSSLGKFALPKNYFSEIPVLGVAVVWPLLAFIFTDSLFAAETLVLGGFSGLVLSQFNKVFQNTMETKLDTKNLNPSRGSLRVGTSYSNRLIRTTSTTYWDRGWLRCTDDGLEFRAYNSSFTLPWKQIHSAQMYACKLNKPNKVMLISWSTDDRLEHILIEALSGIGSKDAYESLSEFCNGIESLRGSGGGEYARQLPLRSSSFPTTLSNATSGIELQDILIPAAASAVVGWLVLQYVRPVDTAIALPMSILCTFLLLFGLTPWKPTQKH